jgi:hypothetical protein
LFFFGKTEQVVPSSYRDGLLSFTCTNKYKVGKSTKVKLTLVYGETVQTPTVPLTVVAFEPNDDGTYSCSGALEVSPSKLPGLVMQMAYAGVEGADRRGSKRLAYTIRILSKELASFRAVTNNINLTGTEINSDSPVAIGHYMNLQFDLESVGFPVLKLQGKCIWSLEEIDDSTRRPRYRVGVGFTDQHAETHAAWAKFYKSILATEGASVMMKTMDGGAIKDPRTENLNLEDSAPSVPSAPPAPSASSSGGWTPPTGNPFAPRETPLSPLVGEGGYGAPPSPTGSPLNLVTPPAPVPPPTQMGGGFNTQAAPPPPLLPNKLSLPPADSPPTKSSAKGPGGGLSLPETSPQPPSLGFPSPASPGTSGGFSFTPPAAGGGLPFSPPPSAEPIGFQLPPLPSSPFGSSTPGGGGGLPGGFSLPSTPGPSGASGFAPPASAGFPPPSPANFHAPSPPGFTPPSPAVSGFQLPAAPTTPASFGFPAPSAPAGANWSPPGNPGRSTAAGDSGGFPTPPPPASPAGLNFSGPPQPSGGFQLPPPLPPSSPVPPSQPVGFQFPGASPAQPEPVTPLGISGANLAYRSRQDSSNQPGARKQVQMTFNVGGQATSVPINVSLSRVEPAPDGTCVCWATVLEDPEKIQVLNQLLGSR